MLIDTIMEAIMPRLGGMKSSRKDWYTRNCPLCTHRGHGVDKRGRFGLKIEHGNAIAVHCFNCSFKAKYARGTLVSKDFAWFMETIGVPKDDVKKIKFQSFREKEAGDIYEDIKITEDPRGKWKEVPLPPDSYPISFWLNAGCDDKFFLKVADYCVDRKLNVNDMYWTPDKENSMNKRVLMPFTYKDEIVGYSGRYYSAEPAKVIRRYLNLTPEDFIYNLDEQTLDQPFMILTEGVIDAYLCGGVSCMGTMNQTQIDILKSYGKRIIVIPDRDSDGQSLVDIALENGWEVSFPNWANDIKDVGKAAQVYGRLLAVQSVIDSSESSPMKITLKRKMDKFNE
jgi:hypothetical protein